jgi:DNA repair exonuclease SbcCD ATPase subunit
LLKRKGTALTEAEKGQAELRTALEAKDVELANVRAEVDAERRSLTNAEQLRRELREAQIEVKSLRRRIGILRGDVDEARRNELRMSTTFEMLTTEQQKNKETWKRIQTRLVADVESTIEENGRLKQAIDSLNAETKKLKQERDTAIRRHGQAQEELGPLRMELSVAVGDLKNARTIQGMQLKEIDRLTGELGKKTFLAQANLKKIVEKFREQTNAAIQVATTTALREWSEQAAKLQVLRADKDNRDLRGPEFWKLDKAKCEAVQKNLTTDFMRIALSHREEVTKLLAEQQEVVRKMQREMEVVAEPVVPTTRPTSASAGVNEEDGDKEIADEQEPSILHVLNED